MRFGPVNEFLKFLVRLVGAYLSSLKITCERIVIGITINYTSFLFGFVGEVGS